MMAGLALAFLIMLLEDESLLVGPILNWDLCDGQGIVVETSRCK